MTDLPGMWESADFEGGDPDERFYAERNHDKRLDDLRKTLLKSMPDFLDEGYDYGRGGDLVEYTKVDEEAVADFVLEKMAEAWDDGFLNGHKYNNPYRQYNG